MTKIKEMYLTRCQQDSDINLLLPTLFEYAKNCTHITEMGFRAGNSASAFLAGLAENDQDEKVFHTYDIVESVEVAQLREAAEESGIEFIFHLEDTRETDIQLTDFLFIDTEHNYDQVTAELKRHHSKAHWWIGFHDVETFPDLKRGIDTWRSSNDGWKTVVHKTESNGLLIIERIATDSWKERDE